MKHFFTFVLVCAMFLNSDASASVGGAHGGEPASINTLLWPAVNFTIFLAIVVYLFRKLAKPILRDYRIELESNVMRERNEHNMLQSEQEQLRERLSQIAEEKKEIIAELEKDGRDLANVILATGNQQAQRATSLGKRRYDQEVQKVSSDARRELLSRVVEKVKSQISTSFSAQDDASFIKSSIESDLNKIFLQNK